MGWKEKAHSELISMFELYIQYYPEFYMWKLIMGWFKSLEASTKNQQ